MSVTRTVRRNLGAQFEVSRNLQERPATKVRRAFWAAAYLVKAVKIAVVAMRREQLGSRVIYDGQDGFICNWAGSGAPTIAGACGYRVGVPREQLTSVVNPRELWHRFTFGFGFYMRNWHGIDVNKRLYR